MNERVKMMPATELPKGGLGDTPSRAVALHDPARHGPRAPTDFEISSCGLDDGIVSIGEAAIRLLRKL